ncbi:MAG: acyl-protein synthetase [Bacteroidetes bacterium]|nr:acyl-protein synthetase [Bacteroidota bacterium]
MVIEDYIQIPPYSLARAEKEPSMVVLLNELHALHVDRCDAYRKVSEVIFGGIKKISSSDQLPFIPVSMFKTHELKSIADGSVYKVLTSSGTTGSIPSRIFLDQQTASLQSLALSKIMTHMLGNSRLPMLIIDSQSVLKDRNTFSARGAGILGMSIFGKNHTYLLDDAFEIDMGALEKFAEQFNGQKMLLFGFTFMVWKYLFEQSGIALDLSKAILIHSGGWKKMNELAVDNDVFKSELNKKFGLQHVYNFYGMVEQVGSVYIENEKGFLHCPNFSDIIIRNPVDFSVQKNGEEGLIQVISALPRSYPGHSILTEDIGVCMGEDDLSWKGKYFRILGRAKKADLRGCSDTFAQSA